MASHFFCFGDSPVPKTIKNVLKVKGRSGKPYNVLTFSILTTKLVSHQNAFSHTKSELMHD